MHFYQPERVEIDSPHTRAHFMRMVEKSDFQRKIDISRFSNFFRFECGGRFPEHWHQTHHEKKIFSLNTCSEMHFHQPESRDRFPEGQSTFHEDGEKNWFHTKNRIFEIFYFFQIRVRTSFPRALASNASRKEIYKPPTLAHKRIFINRRESRSIPRTPEHIPWRCWKNRISNEKSKFSRWSKFEWRDLFPEH